jgi:uncharacterized protein YgbK (DUF1537 family)
MKQRCLIIADDLTGGADTGAQFAKRGLNTLLVFHKNGHHIDLSRHSDRDVLVVSTNSRGIGRDHAFDVVSSSLTGYDPGIFPIVYKKIDSTLRGNIGSEIDAILKETDIPMGFMAPSYPELKRAVVGGIMIVGHKPLSLTEASMDVISPVKESYVYKLMEEQSSHRVGWIDLVRVAAGFTELRRAVDEEQKKGNRIIVFDAFRRRDLTHIAEVAFSLGIKPLCIGSAGFAAEVAKTIAPPRSKKSVPPIQPAGIESRHVLIISGSLSRISQSQLRRVEQTGRIDSFQLSASYILRDIDSRQRWARNLSRRIGKSLRQKHAILKTCSQRLLPKDPKDVSIHLEIIRILGHITRSALDESGLTIHDLALIITGGDTTLGVFDALGVEGLRIEGEILDGIGIGYLVGGNWQGLRAATKAGAFGRERALETVFEAIKRV